MQSVLIPWGLPIRTSQGNSQLLCLLLLLLLFSFLPLVPFPSSRLSFSSCRAWSYRKIFFFALPHLACTQGEETSAASYVCAYVSTVSTCVSKCSEVFGRQEGFASSPPASRRDYEKEVVRMRKIPVVSLGVPHPSVQPSAHGEASPRRHTRVCRRSSILRRELLCYPGERERVYEGRKRTSGSTEQPLRATGCREKKREGENSRAGHAHWTPS